MRVHWVHLPTLVLVALLAACQALPLIEHDSSPKPLLPRATYSVVPINGESGPEHGPGGPVVTKTVVQTAHQPLTQSSTRSPANSLTRTVSVVPIQPEPTLTLTTTVVHVVPTISATTAATASSISPFSFLSFAVTMSYRTISATPSSTSKTSNSTAASTSPSPSASNTSKSVSSLSTRPSPSTTSTESPISITVTVPTTTASIPFPTTFISNISSVSYDDGIWHTTYPPWNGSTTT
ncbi:hypothetical protein NEUTE1DRAFT_145405 [Neurospora tetrasperma FGSC 2508]|uniref:Uncharacterized protein n=1 Tax=Neurospora tetrasperma (strain FGSC 2508 / ATCC MYA-4615 / P0657) TaxID=510951 RepID=F8MG52_NEUT8|nr:uncharacterized protein NEUTE1DRAFT_145405 [Neurospora tetrasperma FGSC 2508]EGO59378.1 hypothetical protein NEUTE1DRAFT_145405 [Neurospora tetrasperma FGSC 2508]EGZ73502.1 hypothetical protein NEUTE2DRAFT_108137 [Neurospora tetrasperma FGSC 2509]